MKWLLAGAAAVVGGTVMYFVARWGYDGSRYQDAKVISGPATVAIALFFWTLHRLGKGSS